jgi:hypothetical protein
MANQTKPLSKQTMADDKAAIEACAEITTYTPKNADYSQTSLDAANTALTDSEKAHTQADADFSAARDNMVGAQWARHLAVIGMRQEIKTQFGDSSNELQSVGLKKKSEYKKGGRRKTVAPTK